MTTPKPASDKRIVELAALLDSPQVRDVINVTFDGSVLPAATS